MSRGFRFSPGGQATLLWLDELLEDAYGAPEALLGNHADPLDEAVYIILSFQTDLARFQETWRELRAAFPSWENVERASRADVARALRAGGLHQQKARTIKALLQAVRHQFGELSLTQLAGMSNESAERILTRLTGLSWKGARCVLMYSLDRPVFPVDGNTFRILQRAGVIPQTAVYRHRSLHDRLQHAVPEGRRRPFHVNLVVHGQRSCLPIAPQCDSCPAAAVCKKRGVRSGSHEQTGLLRDWANGEEGKQEQVRAEVTGRNRSEPPRFEGQYAAAMG
ncbi:MAG: hypothetical protein U5S82_16700 [Gammaproteobacteria bacterium]|nr:hypothetical protein [Gammaproteobacteria bacterium]